MIVDDSILRSEERAGFRLRQLYRSHGYTPFRMSKFEEYDLYVRNKNFLVSDNVITFTDTSGRLMALKPDVTLSIVKNTRDDPQTVSKLYYHENVYRISEKSRTFREISQVGLECLGAVDLWCKAEVLTLAAESLLAVSPDYILDVSHLGILSAAVEAAGLSEEGAQRVFQYAGEKNLHDIDKTLEEEGLPPEKGGLLKALITLKSTPDEAVFALASLFANTPAAPLVAEFSDLIALLPKERLRVDFSVVNDMNYYSGLVFRGFVNGIPTGILSGGEYSRLMRKMGKKSDALGFAVYLDLLEELAAPPADGGADAVILYDDSSSLPLLFSLAEKLVREGRRVETMRALPDGMPAKTLFRVGKEQVVTIENHA